jgi:hypothetical protein
MSHVIHPALFTEHIFEWETYVCRSRPPIDSGMVVVVDGGQDLLPAETHWELRLSFSQSQSALDALPHSKCASSNVRIQTPSYPLPDALALSSP